MSKGLNSFAMSFSKVFWPTTGHLEVERARHFSDVQFELGDSRYSRRSSVAVWVQLALRRVRQYHGLHIGLDRPGPSADDVSIPVGRRG